MKPFKERIRQIENGVIMALFLCCFAFVILLIGVKWPNYWEYIAPELTPMTWLQSIILFSCSLTSLTCAGLIYIAKGWHKTVWIWGIFSLAFLVFTLDDRFALHERIRDNWLKPADIRIPLPWVGPGDFIILIYLIVGLCFVFYIYKMFKEKKPAMVWFCIAIFMSTLAVSIDSFDVTSMTLSQERFYQSFEEIIEMIAMLAFWVSFILMGTMYLQKLYDELATNKI